MIVVSSYNRHPTGVGHVARDAGDAGLSIGAGNAGTLAEMNRISLEGF